MIADADPLYTLREIDATVACVLEELGVVVPDAKARVRQWLDERAERMMHQRRSFVAGGYVTRTLAERLGMWLAQEATGLQVDLLRARTNLRRSWPSFGGLPAEVQGLAIDVEAERLRSADWHALVAAGEPIAAQLGVWRYRSLPPDERPGEGEIDVVTVQDRALLERGGAAVVANTAWGRPPFEWAYEVMATVHRAKTGQAGRLLWVWADPWLVRTARMPTQSTARARSAIADLASSPSQRLLVVRLPRSSITMSAHFLWDGFVLRGRYAPRSIDDAVDFHARHGTLRLAVIDGRGSQLFEEIVTSWVETVFAANYIGTELRLQATVTRIESSSMIAELDPRSIAPLRPWSSSSVDEDPDLVPQRLTER